MINQVSTALMQNTEGKNATVVPFRSTSPGGEIKYQEPKVNQTTQRAIDDQKQADALKKAQEKTPLEQENDKNKKVSQEMLDDLSMDFEILHSVGLSFSKHEDTGRTFVKVINKDTDELIREIPAEKVLDMAAKLDEMIGILFDAKA